jgi:hypothetical protein
VRDARLASQKVSFDEDASKELFRAHALKGKAQRNPPCGLKVVLSKQGENAMMLTAVVTCLLLGTTVGMGQTMSPAQPRPLIVQVQASPPPASTAPTAIAPQPGMPVFSADGNKVGAVESVDRTPDGRVIAVNVMTGSFLGFGSKLVAIPYGRFATDGKIVRAEMTADDISALPHQGP